ncbi:MAG: NFACT RNA binding domain-containing protein [Halanaerobiales bacterium]|jgi:predicted ribosome quality control (RQC) complex YloA/Tae2 family protein
MSLDGIMLAAIKKDLSKTLLNGRIDKIYQPDKEEITLLIRNNQQNYKLYMSAHPNHPAVYLTGRDFENPDKAPDFCMLLRKYLLRGIITGIEQPDFERILIFEISLYDKKYNLIIEIMGRHSNIILLNQEGLILDAIKRVTPHLSRERELYPGIKYIFPPRQNKLNPLLLEEKSYAETTQAFNQASYQAILHNYRGIGPNSARELVYRAGIDPEKDFNKLTEKEKKALYSNLLELKEKILQEDFQPVLGLEGDKISYVSAFPLNHRLEKAKGFPTTGELLDFYYEKGIKEKELDKKKKELTTVAENFLNKNHRKRDSFLQELEVGKNAEEFKKSGELILANIYQLKKGLLEAELIDYYDPEQRKITIKLDPQLSPADNAQRYFKRYHKARKSIKYIEAQLMKLKEEGEYLENVLLNIEQAETFKELEEIKDELILEDYIKIRKKRRTKGKERVLPPHKFISSTGHEILVGRNNRQNDNLSRKIARSYDLWLHVKELPGSHVIIRRKDKKEFPEETIKEAAILAAYYSKGRYSENVAIDYTLAKNLRKPKGAKPGLVHYENYQTIYITPDEEVVKKLKSS